jgi:hypothetical protein
MKKHLIKLSMLIISLFVLISWNISQAATINDFVGVWKGSGIFVAADETQNISIVLNLSVEGSALVGSFVTDKDEPVSITGNVANGIFTFEVPSSDPNNPNCLNWDVTATASLDENLTTMSLEFTGTFCGPGGGKPGTFSGTLIKKSNAATMPGIPLLLLDD